MKPIKTILLDDEEPALIRLNSLLEAHDGFKLAESFLSSTEALQFMFNETVDLIILDIEMPMMSGLELLSRLDNKKRPLVVFVTAYDEYAVQAFEYYAIDYILKPFSNERFHKMLDRVKEHFINQKKIAVSWSEIKDSIEQRAIPDKISVKTGKKYHFIDPSEISYITASGNYCEITMDSGLKHIHRDTLVHILTVLPSEEFIRIHHSYIISRRSVKELKRQSFGEMYVKMPDGNWLKVSRKYKALVKQMINLSR